MTYVYESHMGGVYFSKEPVDDLYCEQCEDLDWPIGTINDDKELVQLLKSDDYDEDFIEGAVSDYFNYIYIMSNENY